MATRIKILLMMLAAAVTAAAQTPISFSVSEPVAPDSADIAYYGKEHAGRAAAMVGGLNIGVWAFDRYVRNVYFSHISLKSVADNIKTGFKWDNDAIGANMVAHPYHGSLYYNAARSNGFNYWQSELFAIGGSAMWEIAMETEYPSTNDIIATPVGGAAFGEVLYRTSDMVLDDRTGGWERAGREAAAFVISPMRGLTRIINGDAWRRRPTSGRQFGIPNIAFEVSAGARALAFYNHLADHGAGFITEINIEYGDRFELSSNTPYDYFTVRADLGIEKSQPMLSRVNVTGRLLSRELVDTKSHDLSVGLYQHYDYFDSDTLSERTDKTPYKLGIPAELGGGVLYRYDSHDNVRFDAYTHANAVLLGGVLSDHYAVHNRNYNLASGFAIKSGVNLVLHDDLFSVSAEGQLFRMFTWGYPRGTDLENVNQRTLNAEGDESVASFGVLNIRADLKLYKRLYLTASVSNYLRSTRYRDFPNVHSSTFDYRLMLTYRF